MRLIGISGSLRQGSFNTLLLREAARLAPEGVELVEASIRGVPLYDGDLERDEGVPEAVTVLKDLVAGADGLMLFTPEYNNGVPGVFKNAIDWMSRPSSDIERVFDGRPTALLGASPGGFGTILSQNAWLAVLRTLGTDFWSGGKLMLARAGAAFDDRGRLADPAMEARLASFVADFAGYCRSRR